MKAEKFQARLRQILKGPVELIVHDNTHVFLNADFSAKGGSASGGKKKRWIIRLHWMFLKSPAMARLIGRYLLHHKRENSKQIDRYIERHWHWVRHPLPPLRPRGRHYDLKKMMDRLNRRYLHGKVKAHVTWGSSNSRRAYEQMQMGSYSTSRNLITLHPNLDQKWVPRFVVEAALFHEMCHALVPVKEKGGRKQIHPPSFKRLESLYPHLKKASIWEERNLVKLLK